jgi:hypothetical protein
MKHEVTLTLSVTVAGAMMDWTEKADIHGICTYVALAKTSAKRNGATSHR